MRFGLAIGMTSLAASLIVPGVLAQPNPPAAPRARSAATLFEARDVSFLGVGAQDVTTERARALKLKDTHGAEITQVQPGSPADKAGLKDGDVILEFNGESVEGYEHVHRLIREASVGRQVKIQIWRNGAAQTVVATIGSAKVIDTPGGMIQLPRIEIPPMPPMPNIEIPQFQTWQSQTLGIVGESLDRQPQLAEFFGVKGGILVKSVSRNCVADKAGMKAGDVIIKIDDEAVSSGREIISAMRSVRGKHTFNVTVMRKGKEMALPVTVENAMPDHGFWRDSQPAWFYTGDLGDQELQFLAYDRVVQSAEESLAKLLGQ
jgi:serine protease Do